MNIDKIISESIDRYLSEEVFFEKGKEIHKGGKKKRGKKLKNGRRVDFDSKREADTNPNLNKQDANDLKSILDSDFIDVAAIAQKVYPDHTPEGAQSQLRKKIKGLKNDTGSEYKLKKKEADKLNSLIAQEL